MWISFIIACAVVLIDQITKLLTLLFVDSSDEIYLIKGFIYITKEFNTGAGWSILSDNTALLMLISLVASIAIIYIIYKYIKSFKENKLLSISLGLILGGAVGNLIDRFLTVINQRDGVVDMVGTWIASYHWPTWNIADGMLVVGVILLAVWAIFFAGKEKNHD